MATNNAGQMSQEVNMHKRMAMGAKLDGVSLGAKEEAKSSSGGKPKTGALAQVKKK